jgi:dTDP-4-dehydrorhamnose 3,5-epimerase
LIEGVRVVPLERHIDDRGYLYEIIHVTDEFLPKFGQTYVVCSPVRGTIRAFHKHAVLWDYFCVARGTAKFVLAREPDERVKAAASTGKPMTPEALEVHVISDRKPSLLVVPPGTWHGWMALEDDTLVVATGSEVYNRANPDEVRVPPDVFGDVWVVKGR